MELSIVIVNYNTREKTANCLRSIYAAKLPIDFEVILVDNNSSESMLDLSVSYPQARIIMNEVNSGMGAGNNIGIKEAVGKFILILNADTEIAPGSIDTMVSAMEKDHTIGLMGPKLIYPDGERQLSCYRFPKLLMPLYRRTFLGKLFSRYNEDYLYQNIDLDQPLEVDWIMGSCLLIRSDLLLRLNGFDERFFMYFEDTDLCRRIRLSNFKIVYNPLATVIHHHGRASAKQHWSVAIFTNKMTRIHLASWFKYFWKWKFSFN